MFLIKSIFLVIVNKKPPSKKVHLLIFQFPSPPTWNNWLSHLFNLHSFIIYIYSSSNHFSCVFSSFFFFFPLTRPHEADFGLFQRLYWPESTVSVCFGRNPKKKIQGANRHVRCRTPRRDKSNAGAATLEPHPCFLDNHHQILDTNLNQPASKPFLPGVAWSKGLINYGFKNQTGPIGSTMNQLLYWLVLL